MGALGRMARAHRMRRVARETGLGEKSLYKSMRAGASPEFNTVLKVTRALGFRLQVVPVAESERQKKICRRQLSTTSGGILLEQATEKRRNQYEPDSNYHPGGPLRPGVQR